MGDFFGAYVISKQVTELIIDLAAAAYRCAAPGVAQVWAGNIRPLVRRLLSRH